MLVDCVVQIHVGTLCVEISDLISKYYKTDLMQTNLNNNNIRELNRIVERYGGLERCGRLDYFGWLGCHCMSAALEGVNRKALIWGFFFIG